MNDMETLWPECPALFQAKRSVLSFKINSNRFWIVKNTMSVIKRPLIIMLFAVFAIHLQAQDLIVTKNGDEINCKITKVRSGMIYYTFTRKGTTQEAILPLSRVKSYQTNYYGSQGVRGNNERYRTNNTSTPIVRDNKERYRTNNTSTPIVRDNKERYQPYNYNTDGDEENFIEDETYYPRFRVAVSVGWSYRTARLSPDINPEFTEYFRQLKTGIHYDVGLTYYFKEQWGLGLKYNEFLSSNEMNNVYYTERPTVSGKMSDNIRIKFIGPIYSSRIYNPVNNHCFLIDAGIGYVDYRQNKYVISTPISFKGGTAGAYWSIGYDVGLSDSFALGFQLTLLTGVLTQYTVFDGTSTYTEKLDKDKYENLSRIELSIGLRLNK